MQYYIHNVSFPFYISNVETKSMRQKSNGGRLPPNRIKRPLGQLHVHEIWSFALSIIHETFSSISLLLSCFNQEPCPILCQSYQRVWIGSSGVSASFNAMVAWWLWCHLLKCIWHVFLESEDNCLQHRTLLYVWGTFAECFQTTVLQMFVECISSIRSSGVRR